jgi:hypothetical protein
MTPRIQFDFHGENSTTNHALMSWHHGGTPPENVCLLACLLTKMIGLKQLKGCGGFLGPKTITIKSKILIHGVHG